MGSAKDLEIRLYVKLNMAAAEAFAFAGGQAALFSGRDPFKESTNEDAAAVMHLPGARGVLAIADGFGGQPSGAEAAQAALEALAHTVEDAIVEERELREAILNGFERANQAVLNLGVGAATTLTAVEINGPVVRSYHVGDSEIVMCGQRGRIKFQTVAHSPVAYAVEAGLLDAEEALHHEDRHVVSNIVGSTDMRIDIGPTLELAGHDTVILGSDGLFDNLHLEEIVESVRKGPLVAAVESLVTNCRARMVSPPDGQPSKPDDLTMIAYRARPLPNASAAPAAQ